MKRWLATLSFALLLTGSAVAQTQHGKASYYGKGDGFHGRKTASGERFNAHAMTCAHRHARFGSIISVTHAGRTIRCRVNDRGPFVRGRVVDLSYGAAQALGITRAGVASVTIQF